MKDSQTNVSKVISPLIEKCTFVDIALLFLFISAVGVFFQIVPFYIPIIGLLVVHFYERYRTNPSNLSKTGRYNISVKGDETACTECRSSTKETIGYSTYYLLGYELFRIKKFENAICDCCSPDESVDSIEQELNQNN